jgi:hypothetical protein
MYTNVVKKISAEIGSNVHQCSVVKKKICPWNDILLAPVNTVEKKKYAKIGPRWDVYIGVNLLAPVYTCVA